MLTGSQRRREQRSAPVDDHLGDPGSDDRVWRSLSGWGNSPRTSSEVITPSEPDHLLELRPLQRGHIARGLGRSYGDAAQLAGGTVVDMTSMSGVWLDTTRGSVTVRAGTSLGTILDTIVPGGWFLPVTPGTRHVTVGGAIAADVHGKNHHRDGSFGQHLESLDLIAGDGSPMTAKPATDVFDATVGGMGLTGIITKAAFSLIPIETSWMSVSTVKADDLDSVMLALVDADKWSRYSVAWVDLSPSVHGRGIVEAAEHATVAETIGKPRLRGFTEAVVGPPRWMTRVVTDLSVRAFNQVWFSKAPRRESRKFHPLGSFFYPLDRVSHWNRLYGRNGFLQYQFVVPDGEEDTLREVARTLAGSPTPVALAVLKRMGPSRGGLMSFPMPGWTLAVDMPLGDPGLAATLDRCDRMVQAAGGRVYLAKDSRLRSDVAHDMYPGLKRWREVRAGLDPEDRLRSNLSERLRLTS